MEAQKQKQRIDESLADAVNDIHKTHLRKIQVELHKCAIRCCENSNYTMDQAHHCVDQCSVQLEDAQNFVKAELQGFQYRLQRCVMQCNDEVKDRIPANATEREVAKFSMEFESCATVCVDKHIGILPKFISKMKEVLAKGNIQTYKA